MGLLSPWYLLGALAVGVPLYLHLLRRQKSEPRPFSSVMFFERRTQSLRRQRRLRYWLLLSARLALLLLLVLAFCEPYLMRPATAASADKLLVLVIDNSFSMRAGTRLADAQRAALAVLDSKSAETRAQVLSLGSQVQVLTDPINDTAALRRAVQGVQPGDSRGSFATLAAAMRSMAANVHTPIELHLFSDLQRSNMPPNFAEMALPTNVALQLHAVVNQAQPNWAVESVTAPGQVWQPKRAHVQAVIAGYGTPAAMRTVTLMVNGKAVATRQVNVPEGGRASVQFDSLDVPYGFSRCAVQIDSADTLSADDQFVFAVERSDPKRVLFVHQAEDSRSPVYFDAALAAAADSVFVLDQARSERAGDADLSHYAFVVLSDVASLPSAFESNLLRFVQQGGSVWVVLGTSAAREARVPILGERIVAIHNYAREPARFVALGVVDASFASLQHAEGLAAVKFYYATAVDAADARVLASLADRTPLLVEKRVGEGRALLWTSGLDSLSNDFPLQPAFVPFVEQTARYLADTESQGGARTVDTLLELRTANEAAVSVEIIDPAGQRPLSLQQSTAAQTYPLSAAGFYALRLANGRQDLIGVNPDRQESDLSLIPNDVLALWRGNTAAPDGSQAAQAALPSESSMPYHLWWYALIMALVAALAESALASRYLATPREEST